MKKNYQVKKSKPKIVFMGTPQFGAIVLDGIVKAGYKPVLVVTALDKPVGRKQILTPPPVKLLAEKYNVPILQPKAISNLKSQISNLKPNLIIVAAYGQIIPKEILKIPKYGCLNVHPSLLPKYRGPSPIQTAILNGDKETGVTIIKMTEKIDAGPILAKSKIQNPKSKITYPELHNKLAELGAELLIKTIPNWIVGKIKPVPQDETKVTYTKIIKKENGKIDWQKPADYIERQVRAFNPWPSAFTRIQNPKGARQGGRVAGGLESKIQNIKILKAGVLKQTKVGHFEPLGKIYLDPNDKIAVQTGKDFLIIEELQLEGKKSMTSAEFLRGHLNFIGTILE